MILQLLPSTIDERGVPGPGQHLTCFVIDDSVAFDAGSLAMSVSLRQREQIRDIVLTHAHLDHIAGLPLFIDDLFASLTEPVRIHARREVIEVLDQDIFNWRVYPRFSELKNENGPVLEYREFGPNDEFAAAHLSIRPISVNHKVPSSGFLISDGGTTIAITGDTAETDEFWDVVNQQPFLSALLIECAFPDEMSELADISHHLTPSRMKRELEKFEAAGCPIYAINLKPMYRDLIVKEIAAGNDRKVEVLEVGRIYVF